MEEKSKAFAKTRRSHLGWNDVRMQTQMQTFARREIKKHLEEHPFKKVNSQTKHKLHLIEI